MRKLKIASLDVESFETGAGGTVQAHAAGPTGAPCPSFNPCLPTWNLETCD